MQTTVDLPSTVHHRIGELAQERQQSLSSTLADLTIRSLAAVGQPIKVSTDPISGFPPISLGRRITSTDVTAVLDDE